MQDAITNVVEGVLPLSPLRLYRVSGGVAGGFWLCMWVGGVAGGA